MAVKTINKMETKMVNLTIKEKVDLLGKIVEKKKKLLEQEKLLKEDLLASINETVEGKEYKANIIIKTDMNIDKNKVKKVLKRRFIDVVKVSLTELKKYATQKEIEECITEIKETPYLKITKIK